MKSGKLFKYLFVFFILFVFIFSNINFVYGKQEPTEEYAEELSGGSSGIWNINQFEVEGDTDLNNKVTNIIGSILHITRIIGTGIALIMLTVVAMKYMISAPGDRAEIKKHAIPFVVGALVLFGSTQILGIIQKFAGNF